MSQHRRKQIHLIYGIVLAVTVIALGTALVLSCLDIYRSADHDPYTPASVARAYSRIRILVWLTAALILGGIVLELTLPLEQKRARAIIDENIKLEKLHRKLFAGANADPNLLEKNLARKRAGRRWMKGITCFLSLLLMVYPAFYFSDSAHFTVSNLNGDIVKAILIVMVPAICSLGLFFLCSLLIKRSLRTEADFCKLLLSECTGQKPAAKPAPSTDQKRILWCIRGGLAILAVVCILLGISNGGAQDVLKKAIAICTECIGLG